MVKETTLSADDLILPIFVHETGDDSSKNNTLGLKRRSVQEAVEVAGQARNLGIPAVILFPTDCKKSVAAEEAYDPDNLICSAIKQIKQSVPDIGIMADVALDPYTLSGHDGIVVNGQVDNDKTIAVLTKQAAVLAAAGCDVVAPSDMMDGRIGAIRQFLDNCSFENVCILSYAAKFCSCLYGPFRDVVGSRVANAPVIDKSTYQMDPANGREALLEAQLDVEEGADMLMVKPGIFYLDVISSVSNTFDIPVFAYQVSGEYAMIKAAAMNGWVDYARCMYESLLSMKRAGARGIITYAALELADLLKNTGAAK